MKRGNIWVWVLIIVAVVGGLWYFMSSSKNNQTTTPIAMTPTTQPTTEMKKETTPPVDDKMMKEATVNVTTTGFNPQTITVKVGAKVTWINKSGTTANVSSVVHPTHLVYPPLNLGNFDDGKSVSLVFDKPGTYKYHNHLDPSQLGQVVVQ